MRIFHPCDNSGFCAFVGNALQGQPSWPNTACGVSVTEHPTACSVAHHRAVCVHT